MSTLRKQAQGKKSWWDGFLLLKHHTGDDAFLGLGDVKTAWDSSQLYMSNYKCLLDLDE